MSVRVTATGPMGRASGTGETRLSAQGKALAAYRKKFGAYEKGTVKCSTPREVNSARGSKAPKTPSKPASARKPNPSPSVKRVRCPHPKDLRAGSRGSIVTIEARDGYVTRIKEHPSQRAADEYLGPRRGDALVLRHLYHGGFD